MLGEGGCQVATEIHALGLYEIKIKHVYWKGVIHILRHTRGMGGSFYFCDRGGWVIFWSVTSHFLGSGKYV